MTQLSTKGGGPPLKKKVQVWLYGQDSEGLQILLLKTRPGRGEFWQPVTGGVEEGESFEDAALREVEEETGLALSPDKLIKLSSFEFEGQWGKALEQGFAIEVPARLIGKMVLLDPKEHTEFQWLPASEALVKTHFESNQKILAELISTTRKGQRNARN
jgi:dATP pyrophosphohydrolase